MPSPAIPHTPPKISGNGAPAVDVPPSTSNGQSPAPGEGPRSPLLAKVTSLTAIASMAAAGILVVGILPSWEGATPETSYTISSCRRRSSSRPQTAPSCCRASSSTPDSSSTGAQAKAYANNFINVHLSKVAGGQTYAQVSTAAIAAPTNAKLAEEKATLFQGETLRSILLTAWGWSLVGIIVTLAGIILIALGAVLLVLPLANWQVNLRAKRPLTAGF